MSTLSPSQREDIRERYLRVDTAHVADALDTLGYFEQGQEKFSHV